VPVRRNELFLQRIGALPGPHPGSRCRYVHQVPRWNPLQYQHVVIMAGVFPLSGIILTAEPQQVMGRPGDIGLR